MYLRGLCLKWLALEFLRQSATAKLRNREKKKKKEVCGQYTFLKAAVIFEINQKGDQGLRRCYL